MSKGAKIAVIIVIIWVIVGVAIFGIISLANKEKDSITASQFKTTMEQKGYSITDASYQFSQYDYIKQVYVAGDNSYSYQIEFYELDNETNAIGFYNNNAKTFQSRKESPSAETNVNGKNFSKYTLSSGGKYMLVSRINNTVIYLNVDSSYKDEVKKIVDELGY